METPPQFCVRASLVAVGLRVQQMGLWAIIRTHVHIKQKIRVHDPLDKLLDAFIHMLAGGQRLVEVNTRVRPDRALQLAFGRTSCADHSSISRTLNLCTPEHVTQLREALQEIVRRYGRSYRHDYTQRYQLLDIDMTGLCAGTLSEGATKGYFAKQRNKRGRQLGRVLASDYDELLVDKLFTGKQQLHQNLQALILLAEQTLDLPENRRKRTILRIDGGGGDDPNINWMLARGYQLVLKVKNWQRAQKLAQSVTHWYADSKVADRSIGWVRTPHAYQRPTRQLAIRTPTIKRTWHYQVLVFTLSDAALFELCARPMPKTPSEHECLLAALHAYDQRDGGLETQIRGDKQGLGLAQRNVQHFAAQEMLVLLAQLAHNLTIWIRDELARVNPRCAHYGIQRMVRDAFQIDGCLSTSDDGHIQVITLNDRHPLAVTVQQALIT